MKNELKYFVLLLTLLYGCKTDSNGEYIVVSATSNYTHLQGYTGGPDRILSGKLAQSLKGKKYTLTYHDKYVLLVASDSKREILLSRENEVYKQHRTDTTYHTGGVIDGNMTDVLLTSHSTRKEPTADLRVIKYRSDVDSVGDYALVWCELLKIKK